MRPVLQNLRVSFQKQAVDFVTLIDKWHGFLIAIWHHSACGTLARQTRCCPESLSVGGSFNGQSGLKLSYRSKHCAERLNKMTLPPKNVSQG